jgi:hypothetical protein
MQDIDIARATRTRIYSTAVSTTIPANPDRLSIRIVPLPGTTVTVYSPSFSIAGVAAPFNVPLGYATGYDNVVNFWGTLPDLITLENVGDILKGPLLVATTGGGDSSLIETYLSVNSGMSLDVTELP